MFDTLFKRGVARFLIACNTQLGGNEWTHEMDASEYELTAFFTLEERQAIADGVLPPA